MIERLFWGVALVAAPFFIRPMPMSSPVLSQGWLFMALTVVGAVGLGVAKDWRLLFPLVAALIAFAVTSDPFTPYALYHGQMLLFGVVFLGVAARSTDHRFTRKLLAASCLIQCAWVAINAVGIDPYALMLGLESGATITGSLGNPNHSGAFLAATMFFLPPLLWVLPVAAMAGLGSALPFICAAMGAAAYVAKSCHAPGVFSYALKALAVAALAALIGAAPEILDDSGRVQAWGEIVSRLGVTLFGNGVGAIPQLGVTLGTSRLYQAHNEWLEAYAMGGGFALAMLCLFAFYLWGKNRHYCFEACFVALLVNSLGNFTFHIAPLFIIFAISAFQKEKSWPR